MPELKKIYNKIVIKKLINKFKYKNVMQVPKLTKIVINVGVGIAVKNKKYIDDVMKDLYLITGQKSVYRISKKDEAGFSLRKGMKISSMVTLRRNIMYEFLDRLISIALPRTKDFNGIKENSFDGNGNYNLGIKEHIIFPEINFENVKRIYGMNISIVTNVKNDIEAKYLLIYLGLPFKNKNIYGKRIN
ncbi:MAG: 50S ribosomal protein L5 [Candidatus Shikimatogenerans bostrichidophilus]|nr:MAG: 50S ribosomal protein L5 [Candidatus Shikimatogenerans bostrichidophilus]